MKALTTSAAFRVLMTTVVCTAIVAAFLIACALLSMFFGWVEGTDFGAWLGAHGGTILDWVGGIIFGLAIAGLALVGVLAVHERLWNGDKS